MTWENRMEPSSAHGVTTVLAGNCGVGFAPCRPDEHELLIELMEGVEDLPEIVLSEGLPWTWETFPEFLDTLAGRQFDVDVAVLIPHSPIRTYVMGRRGVDREAATQDDCRRMRDLVAEGVRAGALGVSTSRNIFHRTRIGKQAPSIGAAERELDALADGLADAGAGLFQIIPQMINDPKVEFDVMKRLAGRSGGAITFTLLQMNMPGAERYWEQYLAFLEEARRDGLPIFGQVYPRPQGVLMGLDLSFHPFSLNPSFRPLADLPLTEKVEAMRDPRLRARIIAEEPSDPNETFMMMVKGLEDLYVLGEPPIYDPAPGTSFVERARQTGTDARNLIYDALLDREGAALLYRPAVNFQDHKLEAARRMLARDTTVVALGDSGAHYGMLCDASFTTYLLARWVRDADPTSALTLETAVSELTRKPAALVGLHDRGILAPGYKADLNLIDLGALSLHAPTVHYDLPAGGRRLHQKADGYVATIVSGTVTRRYGVSTGALPGRLVRNRQCN
jgi:N-acyl-D-aspartate/D-glutamate deacylase